MNKIDIKVVIIAIILVFISAGSFQKWNLISPVIMTFLESKWLTFGIWIILLVTLFIHYQKNNTAKTNLISDKEGLEKPFDYILFFFTYGAIGLSVQTLAKKTFAYYNFPNLSKCSEFTGFDNVSFVAVIIVLTIFCYEKIKPIFQETYTKKSKIKLSTTKNIGYSTDSAINEDDSNK